MKRAIRFTADWCGPCKVYGPIFDKVLENNDDWESVVVDVDEDSEMASQYSVRGIPMTILEVDGNIVEKKTGVISRDVLEEFLNTL
tara:strand:- start:1389 stop:1646 length:258 start_codon:yes stop_codon:yes gene_type:complete